MSLYPPDISEKIQQVETITDKLGKPIDEGMKLLVAVLWTHDITTDNSCEGHNDRRTGGPFVGIVSPDALELEQHLYSKDLVDEHEETRLLRQLTLLLL